MKNFNIIGLLLIVLLLAGGALVLSAQQSEIQMLKDKLTETAMEDEMEEDETEEEAEGSEVDETEKVSAGDDYTLVHHEEKLEAGERFNTFFFPPKTSEEFCKDFSEFELDAAMKLWNGVTLDALKTDEVDAYLQSLFDNDHVGAYMQEIEELPDIDDLVFQEVCKWEDPLIYLVAVGRENHRAFVFQMDNFKSWSEVNAIESYVITPGGVGLREIEDTLYAFTAYGDAGTILWRVWRLDPETYRVDLMERCRVSTDWDDAKDDFGETAMFTCDPRFVPAE